MPNQAGEQVMGERRLRELSEGTAAVQRSRLEHLVLARAPGSRGDRDTGYRAAGLRGYA